MVDWCGGREREGKGTTERGRDFFVAVGFYLTGGFVVIGIGWGGWLEGGEGGGGGGVESSLKGLLMDAESRSGLS